MKNFFYNKVLWHHLALFASIFDEMETWVYNEEGKAIRSKRIPVYLTPKEKVAALIQRQGTQDVFPGGSSIDNYLPSITISWRGIQLDSERLRGQREKRKLYVRYQDGEEEPEIHMDLQTVPYLLQLEVTVWAKYMDDAAQILENILPFFHPEAYVSIFEKSVGTERKCKVSLDSITPNFVYEMGQNERRVIQFNLAFQMECNMYKPELPIGKPILDIQTKLGTATNSDKAEGSVVETKFAEGSKTFVDFDDKIYSIIRDLTDDESFNIASYFNKVNVRPHQEDEEKEPEETSQDIINQYTNYDDIIEAAGFEIPPDISQQNYIQLLLKSLWKLQENNNEPLSFGKFIINKEGNLEFYP